jgi:hypothetical protein
MKKLFLLVFVLFYSSVSVQADSKGEITHLLNYVKHTKCKYVRNGTPYNGQEAVEHIQNKYDYFKKEIVSAEDFIRLSATKSTMSGKMYIIKCPGSPDMQSRKWLLEELKRYRSSQEK